MTTAKRVFETAVLHNHTTVRSQCRHRLVAPVGDSIRIATDASGSLAIRAWTCQACGDLIEEIRLLSRKGRVQRQPIRYHLDSIHARDQGSVRSATGVSAGSSA